jgi:hypothetical protein
LKKKERKKERKKGRTKDRKKERKEESKKERKSRGIKEKRKEWQTKSERNISAKNVLKFNHVLYISHLQLSCKEYAAKKSTVDNTITFPISYRFPRR